MKKKKYIKKSLVKLVGNGLGLFVIQLIRETDRLSDLNVISPEAFWRCELSEYLTTRFYLNCNS